jgi:glycosyltransferase involved in cell wall biosynthesis
VSGGPLSAIASVSVVIPLLNAADTLGQQLEALSRQDWDGEWEVVVSDNGSTDGGRGVAERWASALPALRVVDSSDRGGVSHARNVGAAAARGELILVCDADDVVEPGWISAMARAAGEADVLGGALDDASLNDSVLRAWRGPRPNGSLPTAVNDFLPYAIGSNFGVRASVFRELGGWDETFRGGGDDVEFSWRAQLRGHRLAYVPDAVIRYRYRAGLRALARQFFHYGVAEPRLYRDFRRFGARRDTVEGVARRWRWLLRRLPLAFRPPAVKGRWVGALAFHLGLVRGSVKYRTLYL